MRNKICLWPLMIASVMLILTIFGCAKKEEHIDIEEEGIAKRIVAERNVKREKEEYIVDIDEKNESKSRDDSKNNNDTSTDVVKDMYDRKGIYAEFDEVEGNAGGTVFVKVLSDEKPKNIMKKGDKEYISLEDGIKYLYNDEKNSFIYETYVPYYGGKICRRVRNVYIEGEFVDISPNELITLKNVKAGDKVFEEVYVSYDVYSNDKDAEDLKNSFSYLRKGDIVCLIGTIIKGTDSTVRDSDLYWDGLHANKFYVLHPKNGEKDKDSIYYYFGYNKEDPMYDKYSAKDKVFEYNEVLNDILDSADNMLRLDRIFTGVRFNAEVKCEKIIEKYSHEIYLKFNINNNPKKEEINRKEVGGGLWTYIDDRNQILEANSLAVSYGDKKEEANVDFEKFKRKDNKTYTFEINKWERGKPIIYMLPEEEEEDTEEDIKNINKKNVYDSSKVEDIDMYDLTETYGDKPGGADDIDDEETANDKNGEYEEDDTAEGSINNPKTIGIDKIDLGDYIKLSNDVYRVIKVDPNDKYKVLIFRHYPGGNAKSVKFSDEKKCTWHDSYAREYLNTDYFDRYTEEELGRIYVTKNKDNLKGIKGVEDKTSLDKFFVLSKDEILENKMFIDDEDIDRSLMRGQDYDISHITLYRNGIHAYYGQFSDARDMHSHEWPVYPAAWINVRRDFVINPANVEYYKYEK